MLASYVGLLTFRRISTLKKIGLQKTLEVVIFQLPEIKNLRQTPSSIGSVLWSYYLFFWHGVLLQLARRKIKSNTGVYSTREINKDSEVKHLLTKLKSQIIVIRGGRILTRSTLEAFHGLWINIHGGILPGYRGLDSHIWAVKNGQMDQIGVTAHVATSTVDRGPIVKTRRVDVWSEDSWGAVENRIEKAADELHIWMHNLDDLPQGMDTLLGNSASAYFGAYKPRPNKYQKIKDFHDGK